MKKKKSPNVTIKSGNGTSAIETGSGSSASSAVNNRQSTPPNSQSIVTTAAHPTLIGSTGYRSANNTSISEDHEQQEESLHSPHYQSDSSSRDDLDALLPTSSNSSKVKTAIDNLQNKIKKVKELIKAEQTARDENVNEYLKLATNADKTQTQRLKGVFEKKNKASAHTISQLQKKLDFYTRKIRDIETNGVQAMHHHSRSKAMFSNVGHGLKGVGTNIKEGISGLSEGVIGSIKSGLSVAAHATGSEMSFKTKDFKNKIGSAEHINSGDGPINENSHSNENEENKESRTHNQGGSIFYTQSYTHSHSTKHTSEDESSSITSGSGQIGGIHGATTSGGCSTSPAKQLFKHFDSQPIENAPHSSGNIQDLDTILSNLKERDNDCQRLAEEIETLKTQFQTEITLINQNFQEERYKSERLEEQLNDLIELHQNEIENLKQLIGDMEEKVQYQSEERLRDIYEMLESCQTRISRMEHQQHQHLQQLVNLDSLENSKAKALMLKVVNVVLTILQLILFLVSTIANITTPFLKTKIRAFITTIFFIFIMIFIRQKYEFTILLKNILEKFPLILTTFREDIPEKG